MKFYVAEGMAATSYANDSRNYNLRSNLSHTVFHKSKTFSIDIRKCQGPCCEIIRV